MQNPFRHQRPQDDFGRRESRDHRGWEARDQRWDEGSSWSEGDGGRTAEAWGRQGGYGQSPDQNREMSGARGMGYGQQQQSRYGGGMTTGWTGDRGPQQGGSYDQYGYGSQASGQQPSSWSQPQYGRGGSGPWGGGHDRSYAQSGGQGGYDRPGYSQGGDYGGASMDHPSGMRGGFAGGSQMQGGYGQSPGGAQSGYPSHGYAPGSQIWEGSGSGMAGQTHEHHDFEPDYLHWRQQQLSAFDDDYRSWRDARRQKFSSDFSSWRQNRPRSEASGEHHNPPANPIVGDVSDGGVGDASEAKKRQ